MRNFWQGKKVLITGHTGFKGSWLTLLLCRLGAVVSGYALNEPSDPCMFSLLDLRQCVKASHRGDIRDVKCLNEALAEEQPEVVFHLAAQTLVRRAYRDPQETFSTNVMGTLNVLEAARNTGTVRGIINVTTDKCYENREWFWGYRENDPLGGDDPYSASKGCAELLSASWRKSFCPLERINDHKLAMATARAGNVVGGGDWAEDRLLPDCIRAFASGQPLVLRNPDAVRPWQHVLEPLWGYAVLAERLWNDPATYSGAWNFGPEKAAHWTVLRLAETIRAQWGEGGILIEEGENPAESSFLYLDSSRAFAQLGWIPRLSTREALEWSIDWYKSWIKHPQGLWAFTQEQVERYLSRTEREV
jgi:CDP-glucose 4,6-dehydratase